MTPEKIIAVIEMYDERLLKYGVTKVRIDPKLTFAEVSYEDLLRHAHYLCDGVKAFARDPEKLGKLNRHLASIQMCLSFAGWYTLEDLMNHNKP